MIRIVSNLALISIKIKKEGLATLLAIWKEAENSEEDGSPVSLKLTPEIILKIFKHENTKYNPFYWIINFCPRSK